MTTKAKVSKDVQTVETSTSSNFRVIPELIAMKGHFQKINVESNDIMRKNLTYMINTGSMLQDLKKFQQEQFSGKSVIVYTTDYNEEKRTGYKANLSIIKTNTKERTLGFWDFLHYEKYIPMKFSFVQKFIRVYEDRDLFKDLTNEQIVQGRLSNTDIADQFRAFVSKDPVNNDINSFIENLQAKELPKMSDVKPVSAESSGTESSDGEGETKQPEPTNLKLFEGHAKKVVVTYDKSAYESSESMKVNLIDALLFGKAKVSEGQLVVIYNKLAALFGSGKLSETNKHAIAESLASLTTAES